MYYMTESIITFFSKKQVKPNHRSYEYDECLNFGMKSVSIINDIIDKYYDGKSEEYKKTMDEYELSRKEILITKEPVRDNSVNVCLNIYRAAAADAAAVAAENKKTETDRNDKQKDKSNTDKPRSISPQL